MMALELRRDGAISLKFRRDGVTETPRRDLCSYDVCVCEYICIFVYGFESVAYISNETTEIKLNFDDGLLALTTRFRNKCPLK